MTDPQIVRYGNVQIDLRDIASAAYTPGGDGGPASLAVYLRWSGADAFTGPAATAIWRAWAALGTELPDPTPDEPDAPVPPAPEPQAASRVREAGDAVVIARPDGKGDAIIVLDDNQLVFNVPRDTFDRDADVFLLGFPANAAMSALLRSPHQNAVAARTAVRTDSTGRGWIYLAAGASLTFEIEPNPVAAS